jgi:serine/threonine protein kinase/Tfp pilus assembly protein PilF
MESDSRWRAGEPPSRATELRVSELVAAYVDRLNAGVEIDPEEVRSRHPDLADDVLQQLEIFISCTSPRSAGGDLGTLGDYTLRRRLGQGGMGVVYEAWEGSMARAVALKVLPRAVGADARAVMRFVREAQAAGKLSHPSVVAVYGIGVKEQTPFYAMELVEGETLAAMLARLRETEAAETPLGRRDDIRYFASVAEAFAEVAEGLQHAHTKGVIHRDIKPSNLIFDRTSPPAAGAEAEGAEGELLRPRLRILDFGLARLEGEESLTVSGDLVGTPAYMSPEQARSRKVPIDHRTDVYSLGATLYETLTLRQPFRGRDYQDTLSQIIAREPEEPQRLNRKLPAELATIVLKALRKEPSDRYGTAEALAQDLRRFVRGDPVEARPQAAWEKLLRRAWRQRLRLGAALATLLFALAAGLLALAYHHRAGEEKAARYRDLVLRAAGSLELGGFGERLVHSEHESRWLHLHVLRALDPKEGLGEDLTGERARGAIADLEEAVRLLPRLPDARYHLARGLWLLGRPDDALRAASEGLRHAPDFAPLRALRAALHSQALDAEAARGGLDAPRRRPGAAWTRHWFEAQEAAARGDWPAAALAYGELLALEPEGEESFTGAWLELGLGRGLAYLRAGRLEEAKRDFLMAHARWPHTLSLPYLIGHAYVREGKPRLAAEWFAEHQRRASQSDAETLRFLLDLKGSHFETAALWAEAMRPGYARDWLLTYFLVNARRRSDAHQLALRNHRERPEDAAWLAHLALTKCHLQGEAKGAETCIERALEMDPDSPAVLVLAVHVYSVLGKLGLVEKWARHWVALDPDSSEAMSSLADVLQARGRVQEAVAMLEDCIPEHPRHPVFLLILGFIHLNQRRDAEAEETMERVLNLEPESYSALCYLGALRHFQGRLEEAEGLYRKAMSLWGTQPKAEAELAVLLEEQDRIDEALPLMLAALEHHDFLNASWMRRVHTMLERRLPGRPRLEAPPELDAIARSLEALVESGARPHHVLRSLALLLVHAPGRRDPDRALALALEALQSPGGRRSRDSSATLAAVYFERGELREAVRALEGAARLPAHHLRRLEELREALLPVLASCASADWALERTRREVLVAPGAEWRYLAGAEEGGGGPPAEGDGGWTALDFDDGGWLEGPSGFGYRGSGAATAIERRAGQAVLLRRAFTVPEPERYRGLVLSLHVDGGYSAYLNGREAASGTAEGGRGLPRAPPVTVEIRLDPQRLERGGNLLALRVEDRALWSRGLSVTPLLAGKLERRPEVERKLLEKAAAAAPGEEDRPALAYLEARVLEGEGRLDEAAEIDRQLAAAERFAPEPHLRHAGRLRRRGEAARAEAHLRGALESELESPALWELWAAVAFEDLGWTAAEALARLPAAAAADSADARDLRWLLERLAEDGAARIDCGAWEDRTSNGVAWGADRFFNSGEQLQTHGDHPPIEGAEDEAIYRRARVFPPRGGEPPAYRLPLPAGRYEAALHFAEIDGAIRSPGLRLFDIVIEGETVLPACDLVARAGFARADRLSFEVAVEDGFLEIGFVPRERNALVSAVEVRRLE